MFFNSLNSPKLRLNSLEKKGMAGRNPFCTLLAQQEMGTALCQLFRSGMNQYWQKGQTNILR